MRKTPYDFYKSAEMYQRRELNCDRFYNHKLEVGIHKLKMCIYKIKPSPISIILSVFFAKSISCVTISIDISC